MQEFKMILESLLKNIDMKRKQVLNSKFKEIINYQFAIVSDSLTPYIQLDRLIHCIEYYRGNVDGQHHHVQNEIRDEFIVNTVDISYFSRQSLKLELMWMVITTTETTSH
jgi:hypothetical protein